MNNRQQHNDIPLGPQAQNSTEEPKHKLQVIPDDFYGGKDPVIYHKKTDVTSAPPSSNKPIPSLVKQHQPIMQSAPSVANTTQAVQSENPQKASSNTPKVNTVAPAQSLPPNQTTSSQLPKKPVKKKKIVWLVLNVIIFILLVTGISWLFIASDAKKEDTKNTAEIQKIKEDQKDEEKIIVPEDIIEEDSNIEEEAELAIEEEIKEKTKEELPLLLPRTLASVDVDLDKDNLTDKEEEVLGTDPGILDTDADGYIDGIEIVNLYSPKDSAPTKLVDSGLVREYINTNTQYRLYYPTNWDVAPVDETLNQVLVTASNGDFVEISVFEQKAGELFTDWFARRLPDEKFTDLSIEENRFKVKGLVRSDRQVAYYILENKIFLLVYHNGAGNVTLSYPNFMEMIIQSFRPARTTIEVPEQAVIPEEKTLELNTEEQDISTSTQEKEISSL